MSERLPIYDADDNLVGSYGQADDGAIVYFDADDDVVAAYTPAGEQLDETDYGLVDTEEVYDDQDVYDDAPAYDLGDYDERLDQIEQRQEQLAEQPVVFERRADGLDQALIADGMHDEANYLEAPELYDRPLLLREQRLLGDVMADQAYLGGRPDGLAAVERLHDEGLPLLDLDDDHPGRAHEARTAYMSERLDDLDRFAASEDGLDDLTEVAPPPQQAEFDLDDREDRNAYYAARLNGHDVDGYSSTELAEEGFYE